MLKPKIFITRRIPEAGLDLLLEHCELAIWEKDLPPSHEEILKLVPGVNGILSLLTDKIDAEIMDQAGSQLAVISNYAVGFNNIDIQAANQRKIAISNTPDVLTDATADHAFALMLAAGRYIVAGEKNVQNGQWKTWGPKFFLGVDFKGATLGLIGYGRIGKAMAKRASGFDMKVIFYDPSAIPDKNAHKVELETLFRESDFISLHAPLTPTTRYLVNQDSFKLMKPNCVLINTARGEMVESQAFYNALKNNQIFAAGIDVTDPEPIPMDSPLLTLENLIITPHIASASFKTREAMAIMAANNLIAGTQGKRLPNIVNPEVYSQ
ncbi:MAG: D-glycerate dehydrogenase [Chloroflexi bacterium HGW-Chloroflexi-8]|nr:MAG: D-glycerate dehydrogenase [Chloroflexi bacterium HGW-Chloroflexi-8]